jgi:hypothetical protein
VNIVGVKVVGTHLSSSRSTRGDARFPRRRRAAFKKEPDVAKAVFADWI